MAQHVESCLGSQTVGSMMETFRKGHFFSLSRPHFAPHYHGLAAAMLVNCGSAPCRKEYFNSFQLLTTPALNKKVLILNRSHVRSYTAPSNALRLHF